MPESVDSQAATMQLMQRQLAELNARLDAANAAQAAQPMAPSTEQVSVQSFFGTAQSHSLNPWMIRRDRAREAIKLIQAPPEVAFRDGGQGTSLLAH